MVCILCAPVNVATSVTISGEAYGNSVAGRAAVATQCDAWVVAFPNCVIKPNLFPTAGTHNGSQTYTDANSNSYQVDWQVGYIAQLGPGTPTTFNNGRDRIDDTDSTGAGLRLSIGSVSVGHDSAKTLTFKAVMNPR